MKFDLARNYVASMKKILMATGEIAESDADYFAERSLRHMAEMLAVDTLDYMREKKAVFDADRASGSKEVN